MRTLPRRVAAGLLVLLSPVALVTSGPTGGAFAAPTYHQLPDPCPAPTHPVLHPSDLARSVGKIDRANRKDKRSGYTSLLLCGQTDEIIVFWKGKVPASMQETIDALDVHVEVRSAPYSSIELRRLQTRVWDDRRWWQEHGVELQGSSRPFTGTELVVEISGRHDFVAVQRLVDERYGRVPPVRVVKAEPTELL